MDFIKGIIGLAVLSGPLWLIVIMVPISIVTAIMAAKKFRNVIAKIVVFAVVMLAFYLALFGDEIAGRAYLNHLCEVEARMKIYHAVELPADYWDESGKPKYLGPYGFVDMKLLPDRFEWRSINEPYLDSMIKIEKWRSQLLDKRTQTVLGERITYMRHFGWLNQFSPVPNIGESCRELGGEFDRDKLAQEEREQEKLFFHGVLKPEKPGR